MSRGDSGLYLTATQRKESADLRTNCSPQRQDSITAADAEIWAHIHRTAWGLQRRPVRKISGRVAVPGEVRREPGDPAVQVGEVRGGLIGPPVPFERQQPQAFRPEGIGVPRQGRELRPAPLKHDGGNGKLEIELQRRRLVCPPSDLMEPCRPRQVRLGEDAEVKTFRSTDLRKHLGKVREAAWHEPLLISRRGGPDSMMMSVVEFDRLKRAAGEPDSVDVHLRHAITQKQLAPDPLGYDTADFWSCAREMAKAALSGRNSEAVREEIARVERRLGIQEWPTG